MAQPTACGNCVARVAGDGEERIVARRIHDRQLSAFQPVGAVRIDLVDHLHQRTAARNQDALLAVRWKHHVVSGKGKGGANGYPLFADGLHVEAGLALALAAVHAIVERARERHDPQHPAQGLGIKPGVPWAHCPALVIQHADHVEAQRVGFRRRKGFVRTRLGAGGRNDEIRIVNRIAGAELRLGHIERKWRKVAARLARAWTVPERIVG